MEALHKCVQSHLPHALRFEDPKTRELLVEIPAGFDKKPYVVVADDILTFLCNDKTFKSAMDARLIKILEEVPKRYEDAVDLLAATRTKLSDVNEKLAEAMAVSKKQDEKILALETKINELEEAEKGGLSPERLKELTDRRNALLNKPEEK